MQALLKPLRDEIFPANMGKSDDSSYFVNVMLEYFHSLMELDIPANIELQTFCIDYIIASGQFQRLQSLFQGMTFSDSPEFAERLIKLIPRNFPQAVQMATDIYHRMGNTKRVLELLLEEKRVEDVIRYVEKLQLKGTRAKEILKIAHELPLKERNLYVEYFSKALVSLHE
eukprot:TRINITY_DN7665_c0_g1_i2.p2 TRINITY_DN7665_c0_g1~~TRINITY_DN7665_c0_g1_i2.p2  ORF type:complete len:171 (+),score=30.14 TRINITY_DN7665_c0_g1_i2:1135-1647(+)